MAAPESRLRRWQMFSLQSILRLKRPGAQLLLPGSRKQFASRWPSFPMGQRSKGTLSRTSSYLLRELMQGTKDSDEVEQLGEEGSESSESEMVNLEEEFDGILREEAVAKALHELGRSGPGTEQVYLNLNLSHHDLIDISILCEYVHLQKLNLSANKIEDLSCVSCMPYLLELNASQNKLTTFFNFKPPKNLKKVDFSFNQISEMNDLSAYRALTQLILDNNEIEEICGLDMCISLTHLSLTGNKIRTIRGLNALPIKILSLSNNQIEEITGLEDLRTLQYLDLSHNRISSLQGLENHDLLEMINLEDNKIAELGEIEYIENLPILRILNLLRNPVQEKSEYWLFVIFMLLRLTELDQRKIRVEEKVSAVNKYDPPPDVVAAQDHMTHVVNSMMQPQRIFDSTLPSLDTPYPMLILVGPEACGKRELAHRLCREFNTYFRYGACHTTRPPYFGEGDRVDYHFISQEVFDEMLSMGKFILTFKYGSHSYGLNRDTVEGIARDGLASCIHMEIEGVRSLKYSYFEPRYILVVPMNKEKYEGYLRRKGLFSRAEIEFAVSRVDLYVKINIKFPGYFDAVINADDLDVAYQKLSELIREYLGLTEERAKTLAPTTAGAPSSKKTVSGVPAHLVPSPRRLAKLQADGQITEQLSEEQAQAKAPGNQIPDPSQSQEPPEEGKPGKTELSPNSHLHSEPAPQLSASTLGIPKEDVGPPANLPPRIVTPGSEAQLPEGRAPEAGQSPITAPQAPLQHPDPPPAHSPQPDQDEESGEAKGVPSDPPLSDPAQGPEPTSLDPRGIQDKETTSDDPPQDPSHPDASSPTKDERPQTELVRTSTPYPRVPPPQDPSTNAKQTQDREEPPMAFLPKSRLAPTRLPQPQTLAPLQSRRPTPKLLSPSRGEVLGASSDQTTTPSPRSLPAQEADSSKLPVVSPPHSKPPSNSSPQASQSAQEGKGSEVKLPLISPPLQEQAPQHTPNPPREGGTPTVRLPRLPTPFTDSHPPPAKEEKTPNAGSSSSKKIPEKQASSHNQEPEQQKGAKRKNLPVPREVAKGPVHPRKGPPRTGQQPHSHSEPTSTEGPGQPDPGSPQSPQGALKPQAHTEPLSKDPKSQEEKKAKVHPTRKKSQTNLTPKDLAQNAGASMKGRSSQESEPALSGGQPVQSPAQTGQDISAPMGQPGRREHVLKKGRSLKREAVVEPQEQESVPATQEPANETQAHKGTGQARERSVQRHNPLPSKQQTKEKRTRKNGGLSQDRSPAAPQNVVSGEEQGSRTGRLRARGSQSIKV